MWKTLTPRRHATRNEDEHKHARTGTATARSKRIKKKAV